MHFPPSGHTGQHSNLHTGTARVCCRTGSIALRISISTVRQSLAAALQSMAQRGAMLPPTIKQEATAHLAAMMSPPAPAPTAPAAPADVRVKRELPVGAQDRCRASQRGRCLNKLKLTLIAQ